MNNNINELARGIVTTDPLNIVPIGESLGFKPLQIRPVITQGIQPISNWEAFDGILLHLHFGEGGTTRITGSAVLIAPGLAVTAWHNLADDAERLAAGTTGIMCSGITKTGTGLTFWKVASFIRPNDTSDLAVLCLTMAADLPPDQTIFHAQASARTPAIGETVMLCGFRAHSIIPEAKGPNAQINGNIYASTGKITQVYPEGRDRLTINFPAFEIDCYICGSMSGGPVFDENGSLIGLASRCWETEDRKGPAYAALLGPILKTPIQPVWPPGVFKKPVSISEIYSLVYPIATS